MSQSKHRLATVTENGSGGIKAEIGGVVYPCTAVGDVQPGDTVPVGFMLPGSNRQAVIFGGKLISRSMNYLTMPSPQVVVGQWPTSQGPFGLSRLSSTNQPAQVENPSSFFIELGPHVGGYEILGLVVFEGSDGQAALAVYYRRDAGGGDIENVVTARKFDGSEIWSTVIDEPYSAPGIGTQDGSPGAAQTWIAYDATAQALWVVGHGTAAARKSVTILRIDGSILLSYGLGVLLSQGTVGNSTFIKGWHSRRGTTGREEDHPDLFGIALEGESVSTAWSLDPQTLLPGLQIATSAAEVRGGAICPEGRWPINSDGLMLFWLAGSRKMVSGKINLIMELYQSVGSSSNMCAAANSVDDDAKTQEHGATLVAINTKTGSVAWRRDWSYNAAHQVDTTAYDGWISLFGPDPTPGTIGVQRYNHRGIVDAFYSDIFSYSGLASALSLTLSPVEVTDIPGCHIKNPQDPPENHMPVYGFSSLIVFPWHGPGWGSSGFGAEFQLSACGAWIGPVYDWFRPGHPCLLPLPPIVGFGEQGPQLAWPENQHTARLDPVGGTMANDSNGRTWHAHMHQSGPILSDFRIQCQYVQHTETYTPPAVETQCGQWSNRLCHWTTHAVGIPDHHPILRLCCTGPRGQALLDVDMTQYFTPLVIGGGTSNIGRGALANVWQIYPIPSSRVVLVVRDWFDQFLDNGNCENWPYPVIEVRDYSNPATVVQRIPLTADLSVYNQEPDPEVDPIMARVWDQYREPRTLSEGKGSKIAGGYWVQWSHLVHDRVNALDQCNRIQLRFADNNQAPTVDRWTNSGTGIPDSRQKVETMVIAADKTAWLSGASTLNGFVVTVSG